MIQAPAIILPRRTKIIVPKILRSTEGGRVRYYVRARGHDGAIIWVGYFDDPFEYDDFLFALAVHCAIHEPMAPDIVRLPSPHWEPWLDVPGIVYEFATTQQFTASGTFNVPALVYFVDHLVVAGGGGGGPGVSASSSGGAGGAGGFISTTNASVNPGDADAVTVGTGGASNVSGNNSVFLTVTCTGGGHGGTSAGVGANGGSGGGGAGIATSSAGGTGTAGQGNNGGNGNSVGGGGGGGASAVGAVAAGGTGGAGGNGTASSISGSSVTYAGGGGGAAGTTGGPGGTGGGGTGGVSGVGGAGTANRGAGGGGGGAIGGSFAGGAGGDGVVWVSFTQLVPGPALNVKWPDTAARDFTITY